jgi:hypothetical protein
MAVVNGELTKQLAHLRRKRPKSETLERLERQLTLPLGPIATVLARPPKEETEPKSKPPRGKSTGRAPPPEHLPRMTILNPVPPHLRVCSVCGADMTTVGHSRCTIINVIPAKAIVIERLDERVACPRDSTIVSAPTPPAIVERGKLGDALRYRDVLLVGGAEHALATLPSSRLRRSSSRPRPPGESSRE